MSTAGDIPITIEIFGIIKLEGYIDRLKAPLSADAVLNKMPFVLRGRFSFGSKQYWTLPGMHLKEGLNPKSVREVKKGDFIYNPKTDELILIIEDLEMPNKINIIGKVLINEEILKAQNGLNTKVSKKNKH